MQMEMILRLKSIFPRAVINKLNYPTNTKNVFPKIIKFLSNLLLRIDRLD